MEFRSWLRHPCFAVQAKTDENQPGFPPESLLKDKQEAECQGQWLLAHGQQGVYSSYIPRPPASALSVQRRHKACSVSRTARSGCVDCGLMPAPTTLPTRLSTAAAIQGLLRAYHPARRAAVVAPARIAVFRPSTVRVPSQRRPPPAVSKDRFRRVLGNMGPRSLWKRARMIPITPCGGISDY